MTQFEQDLERAVENNKRQEADIEHLETIIKIMRETILDYSNRLDTTSNIKTSWHKKKHYLLLKGIEYGRIQKPKHTDIYK